MAISIMREMGWSWEQLQATPFDLVQELVIRLSGEGEAHEQISGRSRGTNDRHPTAMGGNRRNRRGGILRKKEHR
jgi:hypothetical protein